MGLALQLLAPVFDEIHQDPVGTMQRAEAAYHNAPPHTLIQTTLESINPGVHYDTYRHAAAYLAICIIALVLGLGWVVIGVFEMLGALVFGCNPMVVVISLVFMAVRAAAVAGVAYVAYRGYGEYQKFQGAAEQEALLYAHDAH